MIDTGFSHWEVEDQAKNCVFIFLEDFEFYIQVTVIISGK